MAPLPPPDPQEGGAAEAQAAEARRNAEAALSDGSLTLAELFTQVEAEGPKRQLGHMHLRAALLALPHIGEKRADELLTGLSLEGNRHLDTLGTEQVALLIENASTE